jgi:hypothetical protein
VTDEAQDGASRPGLDVGEEVTRLAEVLQGWWTSTSTAGPTAGSSTAGSSTAGSSTAEASSPEPPTDEASEQSGPAQHTGPAATSCRVCPLCRAMDVLRGVRPELLQQVAAAAETVAVLLREAAGGVRDTHAAEHPPSPGDDTAASPPPDLFRPGTPIVVTEGTEPTTQDDPSTQDDPTAQDSPTTQDDQGGRTAWA